MKDKLIIITGPTSIGKSRIAVEVAKRFNGEVISADSMQVYRGLDIGTAKIRSSEKCCVKHYLIDVLDPEEEFNTSRFRNLALSAIKEIVAGGKIPIITGGTGFYIKSLLYTGDIIEPGKDSEYRGELKRRAECGELHKMYSELTEIDAEYAAKIHPNDRSRIVRALEYCHVTGKRYSDYCNESMKTESDFDFIYFVLDCDRNKLYDRIDERVDTMVENGLINEVKMMMNKGIDRSFTSMQGIGYKEIYSYLNGEMDFESAVRMIKSNTRHYAVRQLTWFRNVPGIIWIDVDSGNVTEDIVRICRERFDFE